MKTKSILLLLYYYYINIMCMKNWNECTFTINVKFKCLNLKKCLCLFGFAEDPSLGDKRDFK